MRPRELPPDIAWLYGLQHFGIKLGLDNIRALLDALVPEYRCPSILVAGTNGKGSVAAMLHAMLQASGVHSGLFTSPHLVRPNERIRIGAEDIGSEPLSRLLRHVRQTIDAGLAGGTLSAHPSFFEVITATALAAFAEAGVDAAVLEVGLGGRLDATNAVAADISVIVSIDLDHVEALGGTIERVATEKAGIVKPGRPVVSGVSRQQAWTVLRSTCRERGARLVDARLATHLAADGPDALCFETEERTYSDLRLSLAGRHQIDNARVALSAFELFAPVLGRRTATDAVRKGLGSARWPGRLQWIEGTPPPLLDGAHNPAGTRTLVRHLTGLKKARPVLLYGAMRDKPVFEMLELLGPHVSAVVLTRPPVPRAAEPSELVPAAAGIARVETCADPANALALACDIAGADEFVLVTGSLYLVGEILGRLEGHDAPGPVAL
jgi:dihydrofolate synthase / folylpolyglutamate synthase